MRRVFLWAARNRWLKERLPQLRFMRRAVRRFMPGETLADALGGRPAAPGGRHRDAVHAARREPREPGARPTRSPTTTSRRSTRSSPPGSTARSRSSRPSSGSTTTPTSASPTWSGSPSTPPPPARTCGSTWRGAPTARPRSRCTSGCARSSRRPGSACRRTCAGRPPTSNGCDRSTRRSGWSRAPTTRRHRSPTRTGASVDANFVGLAVRFLLDGRGRPIRLGLGTHDVTLIEQIADQVGGGRDRSRRLRGRDAVRHPRPTSSTGWPHAGYRVQALIAYGEHWYPWYMRRLAERPANVWFALRQMLP